MDVVRAKVMGYCMGVRRAVECARKALEQYPDKSVHTLGPLIHNPAALAALAAQGLRMHDGGDLSGLDSQCVAVIRAHGVPPSVRRQLNHAGCAIVDATCPRVLLSQRRAAEYSARGYHVFLAGDRNHGEVTGIAGCTEDRDTGEPRCTVIASVAEAAAYSGNPTEPCVLLSQTTISRGEYDAISAVLKEKLPCLEILDTVCPATTERQEALAELARVVDGILVIGGKSSANNQRLFMAARKLCGRSAFIEDASGIPREFFSLQRVGLTAGASTPDNIIDGVERALLRR